MKKTTLVVPLRDEEHSVRELVESVAQQTRMPDEVIFVDAGSHDQTVNRVQSESRMLRGPEVRVVQLAAAYPGEARNAGMRAAAHPLVAFTDGGIRLDADWLERLEAAMTDETDVVYGTFDPVIASYFDECAAIAYVPARRPVNEGTWRGASVASCLLRRNVWEAVGGFPPYRASEDLFFLEEVARRGFRTAHAEDARVEWRMAKGWRACFRRFANYSYHNLVAGRAADWHFGILRQHVVCSLLTLGGVFYPPLLLTYPAWLLARVIRTAWRKRTSFDLPAPMSPHRWPGIAAVLLLIDAATLSGAVSYWLDTMRGRVEARLAARLS